jgi:tetratricopeptide (TPR) repeat protein
MLSSGFSISRFAATYGLFVLTIIFPLIIFYKPLQKHVLETQLYSSMIAKSRVLGYQTPDFKQLAQDLLNNHIFKPEEINAWDTGQHYLSFFQKGTELFPELFEMHYMLGICQFWTGDLPAAESSLRQSLDINPMFFWSYYNLGLLYLKTGHIDAAITLLSEAKKIPPPITGKILHDLQAFEIIWKYMPDPQTYINNHLQEANQQIDYLLLVALAIQNHHALNLPFDPNQLEPVFF